MCSMLLRRPPSSGMQLTPLRIVADAERLVGSSSTVYVRECSVFVYPEMVLLSCIRGHLKR